MKDIILLIDDDEMNLKSMASNLSLEFEVKAFSDPIKALEYLSHSSGINYVVSDYKMPDFDGIEILKFIKSNFKIKTVLYTGYATEQLKKKIQFSGIDLFFEKPIDIEQFILTIKNLEVKC
ncbi:MAG: response regulator [Candidatus Delongbacteria bacterium]|nr:response regulator [Candidatus Delongbacteria bacterium]MBN2835103.1 response regulator [Candidatus Delongbacteria bacterium]